MGAPVANLQSTRITLATSLAFGIKADVCLLHIFTQPLRPAGGSTDLFRSARSLAVR